MTLLYTAVLLSVFINDSLSPVKVIFLQLKKGKFHKKGNDTDDDNDDNDDDGDKKN